MYNALAKQVNTTAREHGFWDKDRDMGEMLMLAISEMAEALEEDRDHHAPIWYKHADECDGDSSLSDCTCSPKPEGAVIEIADCMIRCCDTLFSYDVDAPLDIDEYVVHERMLRLNLQRTLPENFGDACFEICRVLTMARDSVLPLTRALVLCEELITRFGFDPIGAMHEKMRYNDTRPYMHGKAY